MKKSVLAISVILLAGCGSIGSTKYGCAGLPEGSRCDSTRNIYEKTHGGNNSVSSTNKKSEMIEVSDPVIDTFVTPNLPNRPVPIRTQAQVMRIWINSWEDTNEVLITPGKIHIDIEPRKWVIGQSDSAAEQNRIFKPLETFNK